MFKYRFVKEKDFAMLHKWWRENRFPPPSKAMLPEKGNGGIIVSHNDTDVCAGFLYLTNSNMAIIEFIVADFQVKDRELRKKSISFLIEHLCEIAKMNGREMVFTSLKNEGLKKAMMAEGFVVGDENTTQLIKVI